MLHSDKQPSEDANSPTTTGNTEQQIGAGMIDNGAQADIVSGEPPEAGSKTIIEKDPQLPLATIALDAMRGYQHATGKPWAPFLTV